MNNKTKLYTVFAMLLSLVSMVFNSVLLLNYFESELRLYKNGALTGSFWIFIAVCMLLIGSGIFTLAYKRRRAHRIPQRKPLPAFFGALLGFFVFANTVLSLTVMFRPALTGIQTVVYYAAIVTSLFCGGYFIYVSLCQKPSQTLCAVLGGFSVLWFVFRMILIYLDMSYPLRNPIRVLGMLTLVSVVLYVCCEVRCFICEGNPRYYYTAAALSVFFVFTFSVPLCIYSFANGVYDGDTILYITEVIFGIYVICRLISLFNYREETMRYEFAHYKKLEDVNWDEVEKAAVDKFGWGYEYKPKTYAQGVWCDEGLCVKMTSYEKDPRATYTEFMDSVCNDSCMEFFFSGDGISYCNCECNPLGTQHTSCGAPGGRCSVDKVTDIPKIIPEVSEDKWSVLIVFSKKAFEDLTGIEMKKGAGFTGNFYKCGDMCENKCYGMWNEVKTENPSFHEPSYFGEMVLG